MAAKIDIRYMGFRQPQITGVVAVNDDIRIIRPVPVIARALRVIGLS